MKQTASAPVIVGTKNTVGCSVAPGPYKDSIRVRGRELLSSVPFPASNVTGAAVSNLYITPAEIGGRLPKFAELYEKFLFKSLAFEFVPSTGSSTQGSLILSYDRDISDATPPANMDGARAYMSAEGAKSASVWQSNKITCPLQAPTDGFYTNEHATGDERLVYQGQLYLAVLDPITPPPSVTLNSLGSLWVEYDCLLFVPQLEVSNTTQFQATNDPATMAGSIPYAATTDTQALDINGIIKNLSADKKVQSVINNLINYVPTAFTASKQKKKGRSSEKLGDPTGLTALYLPEGSYRVTTGCALFTSIVGADDPALLHNDVGYVEAVEEGQIATVYPGYYQQIYEFPTGDLGGSIVTEDLVLSPKGGCLYSPNISLTLDADSLAGTFEVYAPWQRVSKESLDETYATNSVYAFVPGPFLEIQKKRLASRKDPHVVEVNPENQKVHIPSSALALPAVSKVKATK